MRPFSSRAASVCLLASFFILQGCFGLRLDDGASSVSAEIASAEPEAIFQEFLESDSCFCEELPIDREYWSADATIELDAGGADGFTPLGGPEEALDDPKLTTTIVGAAKRIVDKDGSHAIEAMVDHYWRGSYAGSEIAFGGRVSLVLSPDGKLRRETVVIGNPLIKFPRKAKTILLESVTSKKNGKERVLKVLEISAAPGRRLNKKPRLAAAAALPGTPAPGALKARIEEVLAAPIPPVCPAYHDRRGRNAQGLLDSLRWQGRCFMGVNIHANNLFVKNPDAGGKIRAVVDADIAAQFKDGRRYLEQGRFELTFCQDKDGRLSLLSQDRTLWGWPDATGRTMAREGAGFMDGVRVTDLSFVNCAVPAAAAAVVAPPAVPAALTATLTGISCVAGVLTGDWNVRNTGGVAYTGNLRFNSTGVQIPPGIPANFNQVGNSAIVALAPLGNIVVVATYGGVYNPGDNVIFNGAFAPDPSVVAGTPAVVTLGGGSYPKFTAPVCN